MNILDVVDEYYLPYRYCSYMEDNNINNIHLMSN